MSPANAVEVLERIYACRCLSSSRLARLAAQTHFHAFQDGDTLVRAATPADSWRIVVSGRARLVDRREEASAWPAVFGPGDGFGERGLIESGHWPGTVRADGPVTVATVSRGAFEAFTSGLEVGERAAFLQRMAWQADFDFLRRMNLFAHLEPEDTERLFDRLDRIAVSRGDYLFHENAAADLGYILRHGRLRLLTTAGHSRRQLAVRRDGDLVGEIELLYGTPRMADAIADTDCELFALSRTLFEELTPRDHDRDALYQLATDRLLQYQNALSDDDTRVAQNEVPSLHAGWVPVPGQRYGASCPFVPADSPIVAGLACLAMIDAALGREGAWQDRVEQLLWDRAPDTLHSLSRKAEQCGYLTHLVTLTPEVRLRASLPAVVEDADGTLAVLFRGAAGSVVAANPQTGVRTLEVTGLGPGQGWPSRMLTLSPTSRDPRRGVLRAYAPYLGGIAVVSLLTYAFGIAAPLAGCWSIDRVLVDGDQALLRLLLFGVLVVLVFHVAAGALREYLVAHTCGRITLALQLRFVDHVMRLSAGAAAAFRVGDLAVRFRENETFVRDAFKTAMFLVVDALALAAHLAVLAALSLPLAGIALVFAASHAAVAALSASLTQVTGDRHLDARRALRSHLIEAVAGIPTIKALVLEQSFLARGAQLMARRKAGEFREAAWTAHLDLGSRTLHAAAVVAILAYGAALTLGGAATSGRLFAAMGVFGAMLVPLNGLLLARGALQRARGAWANLSDVLGLDPEDSNVTTVAPVLSGHVELKHVSFRYPGALENALTDVTLEVLPGQRVALVGRSGSGKTTLFNLLLGLYPPTQGTIALDQVDMACLPKAALRRQFGVVEQHPFLFDGTVRENISRSDPAIPMDDVVAAARAACAHDFIETLPSGYETRIGDRGVTLSGGERQRLVVARALASHPRMLLFDEATSAIDSRMEREIHGHITGSHGTLTTFLIAHRLSTVRGADLIVVLDQGRIVETGTHGDLMARRGLYCYLNTRFV